MSDPTVAEIIVPNMEDSDGEYWDPWDALDQRCLSYNSLIDQAAINVLRGIGSKENYATDIAAAYRMDPVLVELLQGIFCGAYWCDYGTSPRGCFPTDREGWPQMIAAWEAYYERHWKEPADGVAPIPSCGEG